MKEHRTSDSEVATRGAVGAAPGARAPPHGGTANEGDARLDGLRGTKEKAVDALRSVREGAVVAAEAVKDRAAEALQYGKQTLGLGGDSGGEGAGTEAQQGSDNTPPKDEVDLTPEEQLVRHRVELDPQKLHHPGQPHPQSQGKQQHGTGQSAGAGGKAEEGSLFPESLQDAIQMAAMKEAAAAAAGDQDPQGTAVPAVPGDAVPHNPFGQARMARAKL